MNRNVILVILSIFQQRATPLKYYFSRGYVDREGCDDHEPDRSVTDGDAQNIPFDAYPAPQLEMLVQIKRQAGGPYETHHCRTIDFAARLRPYKEKGKGRNERYAVTEEDIFPLEQTELFCVVFPEKCEINITRHSEGPQRIGDHKPVADQLYLIPQS
jgi:hypothetical protein